MASILKDHDSTPIIINGVKDYIHVLCIISKNISLANLVEKIKGQSSRWIKTRNNKYKLFRWQGGYSGFSFALSWDKLAFQAGKVLSGFQYIHACNTKLDSGVLVYKD